MVREEIYPHPAAPRGKCIFSVFHVYPVIKTIGFRELLNLQQGVNSTQHNNKVKTTPSVHDQNTFLCSVAEYFFHIAKLNQLLVLSQQLEEDIRHLGSHKYIAHQLSVIYVKKINPSFPLFLCVSIPPKIAA